MSVIVSGGDIGFSAPMSGRVFGPMYDLFDWKPALEVKQKSVATTKGMKFRSKQSLKVTRTGYSSLTVTHHLETQRVPYRRKMSSTVCPALQKTKAIKDDNIVYAPKDVLE